jgi:hypothetical protein
MSSYPPRPTTHVNYSWVDQTNRYPELRRLCRAATTEAQDIAQLPEVRNLVLKRNGELGKLQNHNSRNLAPTLAYLRGQVNTPPCVTCVNFVGPFRECVSLRGHFDFACTNCAYNDHGGRCSLRPSQYKGIVFCLIVGY